MTDPLKEKPSLNSAPKDYGEWFDVSLSDFDLTELGSIWRKTLAEAVAWLKANGFTLLDDNISGRMDGKLVIAVIWHRGQDLSSLAIHREWDKCTH